jgi:peptide/nickel transport system substrate-binding protein
VRLHNGAPWTPAEDSLSFADNRPLADILRDLARPRNAIVVQAPEGPPLGTGPFRIAGFEPGKSLSLAAHEAHWAGRPFLDSVEILFGRAQRDQAVDFELGRADVVEVPLNEVRRLRSARVALTAPVMLLALASQRPVPALSLAIDRSSIHAILLQRQGEPSGALLPQWLSGLAFLHSAAYDPVAARALAGAVPQLSLEYDRADPLLRSIAERIVLNASEAGIRLRPPNGPSADLRLVLLPVSSTDPRNALEDLAAALGLPAPAVSGLYTAERALLGTHRVIPLCHLPLAFRLAARVRGWQAERWALDSVWLDDLEESR